MAKILVIHGPNLNLLGEREPGIYGRVTLDQLNRNLVDLGKTLDIEVVTFQSNHEGDIIDRIHAERHECQGLIINPGAFTHYSYAIRDAIAATGMVAVEVHLTNVSAREEFRRNSVIAPVCDGQINGLGIGGYRAALRWFAERNTGDDHAV